MDSNKKTAEITKYLITALDQPSCGMLTARVLFTKEESIKVSKVLLEFNILHQVEEVI